MAQYTPTITTTAMQEKGITMALTAENAARAAQTPPGTPLASNAAYLAFAMNNFVAAYGDEYKRTVRQLVGAATETATGAQLQAAAADLGVVLP